MNADLRAICERRAALQRQLADLDLQLAEALEVPLEARLEPSEGGPDAVLLLPDAAALMQEPESTFRRRPEYLKARVSRPGERRLRYSRAALERIKADRLAASAIAVVGRE